jgi:IS5 family transposase
MGYWELHIKEDERHGQWMLQDVALPLAAQYPDDAWELVLGYDQERLLGDRAYDSRRHRRELHRRRTRPSFAKRRTAHGSGLGAQRWVVERTIAWPHQHRRLRVRYDRRDDIHQAFLTLAGCLICLKPLTADDSF